MWYEGTISPSWQAQAGYIASAGRAEAEVVTNNVTNFKNVVIMDAFGSYRRRFIAETRFSFEVDVMSWSVNIASATVRHFLGFEIETCGISAARKRRRPSQRIGEVDWCYASLASLPPNSRAVKLRSLCVWTLQFSRKFLQKENYGCAKGELWLW